MVQDVCSDPVGGIRQKPQTPFGIEFVNCMQQAEVAFRNRAQKVATHSGGT